jgi:hypothetical protein
LSREMQPTHAASGAELAEALRELTRGVPGVWTVGQLRASLIENGVLVELETGERLGFALSCLVAGGEAETLGFDSYRIYPHGSN